MHVLFAPKIIRALQADIERLLDGVSRSKFAALRDSIFYRVFVRRKGFEQDKAECCIDGIFHQPKVIGSLRFCKATEKR